MAGIFCVDSSWTGRKRQHQTERLRKEEKRYNCSRGGQDSTDFVSASWKQTPLIILLLYTRRNELHALFFVFLFSQFASPVLRAMPHDSSEENRTPGAARTHATKSFFGPPRVDRWFPNLLGLGPAPSVSKFCRSEDAILKNQRLQRHKQSVGIPARKRKLWEVDGTQKTLSPSAGKMSSQSHAYFF